MRLSEANVMPSCPAGWSEFTEARGRYVVGLTAGGTLKGTSGTPLSDQEARPVGQHEHTGQFSHVHQINVVTGGGGTPGILYGSGASASVATLDPAPNFFVTDNSGSVAGTNAPTSSCAPAARPSRLEDHPGADGVVGRLVDQDEAAGGAVAPVLVHEQRR
jgi:hypothetical protein